MARTSAVGKGAKTAAGAANVSRETIISG